MLHSNGLYLKLPYRIFCTTKLLYFLCNVVCCFLLIFNTLALTVASSAISTPFGICEYAIIFSLVMTISTGIIVVRNRASTLKFHMKLSSNLLWRLLTLLYSQNKLEIDLFDTESVKEFLVWCQILHGLESMMSYFMYQFSLLRSMSRNFLMSSVIYRRQVVCYHFKSFHLVLYCKR